MAIPDDPEARLRRDAAAAALTEAGYPIAKASLAWFATMGGGPVFQRFGRYPTYKWADLLSWARGRLSRPVTSTSELDRPAA
jgi:hypothetical protein